jgi:hypothetical protein
MMIMLSDEVVQYWYVLNQCIRFAIEVIATIIVTFSRVDCSVAAFYNQELRTESYT